MGGGGWAHRDWEGKPDLFVLFVLGKRALVFKVSAGVNVLDLVSVLPRHLISIAHGLLIPWSNILTALCSL